MSSNQHKYGRGVPARGHTDVRSPVLRKVAVAWTLPQLEAINRRVVLNHSTFAREVRRLIDVALRQDHIRDDEYLECA